MSELPPPLRDPDAGAPDEVGALLRHAARSAPLTAADRARHGAMLARVAQGPVAPPRVFPAWKLAGAGAATVGLAVALTALLARPPATPRRPAAAPASAHVIPAAPAPRAPVVPAASPVAPTTRPAAIVRPVAPALVVAHPAEVPVREAPSSAPAPVAAPASEPATAAANEGASGVGGATNRLVREVQLLGRAQQLLEDEPAAALAQLDEYRAEFPHGTMTSESDYLAVRALHRLGRTAEARARADALIAREPHSPLVPRVQRVLAEPANAPASNP